MGKTAPSSRPKWAARWWFWASLNVAGFVYVSAFLCGRRNPLQGPDGDYVDIVRVIALAPLLFWLGPRHTLRRFSDRGGLTWNLAGFLLPYFAGLHFYFLQNIRAINYSLTARSLSRMPAAGWAGFGTLAALLLGLGLGQVILARREKILGAYLGSMLGVVAAITLVTWWVRDTQHLHLHHWFVGAAMVAAVRFRHWTSVVAQGVFAGIYIEGVAEWGMDGLWLR